MNNSAHFVSVKMLIFGALLALLVGNVAVSGQTPLSPCPAFEIAGIQGLLRTGEPTTIRAEAKGESTSNLEYVWTFSTGKILKGQGSADVEYLPVDQNNSKATPFSISISVKINGLPEQCVSTFEAQAGAALLYCGLPLDEYGKISKGEERARVDNMFIMLEQNPGLEGFLIIEFAPNESRKYKTDRLNRILEIIRYRKYDPSRLTVVFYDGLERENTTFQASTRADVIPYIGSQTYILVKAEELGRKINNFLKK